MKQIVFSDVDGTLLNHRHQITPLTHKAIIELQKKNIPFVIVSARSPSGIYPILDKYQLCASIIAYSGALIMDSNFKIVANQGMPTSYALSIIDYIEKNNFDLSWSVYSFDQWLVKNCHDDRIKNEERIVAAKSKQISKEELRKLPVVHKILCICNPQYTKDIQNQLKEHFKNCTIARSSDILIEIMDHGVNKGKAVKKLCSLWQIPLANAIAFGDQYNDLEMLQTVKYGYVMENAPFDLQQQIKRITLDNDHDGIYQALLKLQVIDK